MRQRDSRIEVGRELCKIMHMALCMNYKNKMAAVRTTLQQETDMHSFKYKLSVNQQINIQMYTN